jgi:signal transduction histidine kinase
MTNTRSVLVVDDDADTLEVLALHLRAMGLDVVDTVDPEEADRLLAERTFAAALFDLRMEPRDGLALMRVAHTHQPRLPVLIMTAYSTVDDAVEAMKEGAFDFLTKPFVEEELVGKVRRALSEERWARDRAQLLAVGEALASAGTLERMLDVVVHATVETTDGEQALVFLREDGRTVLRSGGGAAAVARTDLAEAAETAIRRGERITVPTDGGRVALAVPLLVGGMAEGALVVESAAELRVEAEALTLFAAQAAVAIRNAVDLARCRRGALAALSRVAGEVAHELNNPLGGLKLYMGLLGDRLAKSDDASGADLVAKMRAAVDALTALVSDIRTYGGTAELHRAPVEVNALLEAGLDRASERLAASRVKVVRDLAPDLPTVSLDKRELGKALANLVQNAIDAMEGGGRLTVRTRRVSGRTLEIAIEDTGVGMSEETRARMFELFFSTKASGTGLGMAIVRAAVDRHGGFVDVESTPGKGTSVRIELPIEDG